MGQALQYAEMCEPGGRSPRIEPIRSSLQSLNTFVQAQRIISEDPEQAIALCEKLARTLTENQQVGTPEIRLISYTYFLPRHAIVLICGRKLSAFRQMRLASNWVMFLP